MPQRRSPSTSSPAREPASLARQQADFTAEGSPPPGMVATAAPVGTEPPVPVGQADGAPHGTSPAAPASSTAAPRHRSRSR